MEITPVREEKRFEREEHERVESRHGKMGQTRLTRNLFKNDPRPDPNSTRHDRFATSTNVE